MKRRSKPDEDEWSRHYLPRPANNPNETLHCWWCKVETEHTVSDFRDRKIKLCKECGSMRSKIMDSQPYPEDMRETGAVIPDFSRWQVMRKCFNCNKLTLHCRSLQKVDYRWIFRCEDCGKVS